MKRALALFLTLAMVLALGSCGGNGTATTTPTPVSTQDAQPAGTNQPDNSGAAQAGDITSWIIDKDPESITGTVRFWIPFKGTQGMDNMIADFNAIYPNVTVELTTYNNNADGNMGVNTAIMANEVDVLASFALSNTYLRWSNGMFKDLTQYIKDEGIDVAANWGTDSYQYNDAYYTFPCGGLSYYTAINMDAWEGAGLGDLPTEWTWDEYLEASRKMTEYNADGSVAVYGGSLNHSTNDYMLAQYQVTGLDMYYNTETGKSSFNDPVNVNALQREYNAEVTEQIWYPLVSYRADGTLVADVYQAGKINSAITNNLSRYLADTANYPVTWKTGFAPFPVEEKGQTNYCSGVGYFSHAGIVNGAQDEEAAWAFLKYYSTYGCKWLIAAGHAPTWKGTDSSSVVDVAFGSAEAAAKLVDVESFQRCFANSANPGYKDTKVIAASDLAAIVTEYTMSVMQGTYTVEDGSALMQELGDQAIQDES